MLWLWIGLSFWIDPVSEIKLENFNRFLPQTTYNRVFLGKNDTFFALTNYQIWHWEANGKIINQFGAKGEGPGEFLFVGQVFWNGAGYWVINSKKQTSSVFDNQGKFRFTKPIYFRQFVPVDSELFILDFSTVDHREGNFPTTIQKIEYQLDESQLAVEVTPLRFKKVSQKQRDFHYDFKLAWVIRDGENYLVVDQLEPKIWIYSPKTIARESKVSADRPFEPPWIPIQVRKWVEPRKMPRNNIKNDKEFLRWWRSWSRINFFAKAGDDFIIAYETPDPDDPEESFQIIQRIGRDGRAIGSVVALEGAIMGVRRNQVYIFREEETDDGFSYWVNIYDF